MFLVKFETILKYHEWYLCQISRSNHAIINCLYYYPQKVCNFHMYVFQIKLKYHCSKPIKLQKFLMQQYNSSKANSKANDRHYRKGNTLNVFFSRSLFSQKYITENFSRGQSFHSASFLIYFLSKKASFFRSIFSIS